MYWKTQKEGYQQALKYLADRKNGKITSFKTPWPKANDAGVGGWEWHSMIVIGGRPGTGKTLIKDQIVREAFKLNPNKPFRILEFQLEMLSRAAAVREFSSVIGQSYKHVCSADPKDSLTTYELQKCYEYSKKQILNPIDVVEKSPTVDQFKKIIHEYMKTHSTTNGEGIVEYTNTVITLDHSYLLKKGSGENTKTDMLYNLGEACTELKRQYPIIFVILSQLKRETDRPERNEEGKYGNYILDSDILGGDALLQHADIVVGINRPAMKFIKYYGPDRYIIADENVLVWHFLKLRNGDTRMSFFKAEYHKMQVVEMTTPGCQQRRQTI